MRKILYEHNTLNGFQFVLVEFAAVALAAIFVGTAMLIHGKIAWPIGCLGVAVNAAAVCGTVIQQMRRGERSSSLMESFSRQRREQIRREHPHLARHTLQIAGAALVPFLLAILTVMDRPSTSGKQG